MSRTFSMEFLNLREMNNLINETGRKMIKVSNYFPQAAEMLFAALRPVAVAA